MPRGRAPGLFYDGRRTGIPEERIGRTVARIRESAERIARAQEHARSTAVSAEQGSLMQAIDPAGTSQ